MNLCPHVGRFCPCSDPPPFPVIERACLFDGPEAIDCPRPTAPLLRAGTARHPARLDYPHCHVEGCDWVRPALPGMEGSGVCGLLDKLGIEPPDASWEGLSDTPFWACGEARRAAATP